MAGAEERLAELGLELPAPHPAFGAYVPVRRHGDVVYVSGHGPLRVDGSGPITGKVGADLTLEEARDAARVTGLNLLATLRAELGSLNAVTAILKLLGMVNCAPGFTSTPAVIDGCSELLLAVFGDEVGAHARSAVGMAELPMDIAVEVELIVGVRPL